MQIITIRLINININ